MALSAAERLLQDLGVTEPGEIDLEAIAYHLNATVQYRPLDGCEARIVGHGHRAIITVNARSSPRRNRFSIAHELGHWHHHKGKRLVCRADDYHPRDETSPERAAVGNPDRDVIPRQRRRQLGDNAILAGQRTDVVRRRQQSHARLIAHSVESAEGFRGSIFFLSQLYIGEQSTPSSKPHRPIFA